MTEKNNKHSFLGIYERGHQIWDIWTSHHGESENQIRRLRYFDAMDLAAKERWSLAITYFSLATLVPVIPVISLDHLLGASLLAGTIAVGGASWVRYRSTITEIEQEALARPLDVH